VKCWLTSLAVGGVSADEPARCIEYSLKLNCERDECFPVLCVCDFSIIVVRCASCGKRTRRSVEFFCLRHKELKIEA